ncbi:hypothetical protein ASU31_00325 [Pedobacter ginsenosidimutans]|uniref:Uncharacterized protein n=2 Tax=Pedobacter ginsenosidimutans TaxID=687842 RepID=A0A0T5VV92_9SPHI|nr:hypothetical protein ASU31_00325 [Pedobacter ginsenosidimutans]
MVMMTFAAVWLTYKLIGRHFLIINSNDDKKIYLLYSLLLLSLVSFSQSNDIWMSHYHSDILRRMRIQYEKPPGFSEKLGIECFKDKPKLETILTCVGNQLISNDRQFLTLISIFKIFSKEDSVFMQKMMPKNNLYNTNRQHINQLRRIIKTSLGEEHGKSWKNYVTYYTEASAKTKFNADTAILVPIKLEGEDVYDEIYSNLGALVLQKKDRGFIIIYFLYTNKGKRKLPNYLKSIESIFRYYD